MNTQTNETQNSYSGRGDGRGQTPAPKAKRQRHVFPTERIAHLWAHQTQGNARNAQGNFYFDGPTIYSYGRHFPIARHVITPTGHGVILFTTDTYSKTTSKHLHEVRCAIHPGAPVFHVRRPMDSPADCMRDLVRDVDAQRACFDTTNTRKASISKAWRRLQACEANAQGFAQAFGFEYVSQLPGDSAKWEAIATEYETKLHATRVQRENARYARSAAERAEWDRLQSLKTEERVAAWRAGSVIPWHFRLTGPDGSALLRLKDDEVQTSLGAVVPVEHVKRAFPMVLALIRGGRTYQRNGHTIHLGHYALDSIDSNGTVRAGCHVITRAEVEMLAATLGLQVTQ